MTNEASSAHRPILPPGSFRELWHLALPMVLSSGSLSLMNVIDRIFLTWYSTDALAAAMPAGLLHWMMISVLIGTVTYANTFVAQYDGANRKDRASASVWQAVYLSLGVGTALLLVIPLAPVIFSLAGHTPTVQRLEIEYFSTLCYGAVPMALSASLFCFYSGRGATRTVMCVNFVVSAVNLLLDYVLIFGAGSLPALGIRGAAIATVTASWVGVMVYLALTLRNIERNVYGFWRQKAFDFELFRRLLRYGLPTGFQFLSDIAGFLLFIFLIGTLGTQSLAATNLAFNLNSLAFIPMVGFGTAVMTIVGKRIGEGRPELAVRTTWMAFAMVGGAMFLFAAVYLFAPDVILYPYAVNSTEAEFAPIRAQVITLLRFVAVYSFFDGMAIIFGSAVRGAGDTRFSLVFTFLSAWSLMVLPTYLAIVYFGGSLSIGWWACSVYVIVLGIGFLIRFQTGQWKSMRVIEHGIGGGESDSTEKDSNFNRTPAPVLIKANSSPCLSSSSPELASISEPTESAGEIIESTLP